MSKIVEGSGLKFRYKETDFEGIMVSLSGNTYNIKLKNGYNFSIPAESLEIVEIFPPRAAEVSEVDTPVPAGKHKVSIIGTGGTIASRVDYITGAVKPVLNPGFLRDNVSSISEFDMDLNLMEPMLSENLTPDDWIRIARLAKTGLDKNRGTIILHGTDTMSYTASALSFMFPSLSGPIIFAGSQRSSDRPSSDAFLNLEGALEFSKTNLGEVTLAMHAGLSDDRVALHRAVRSRKMHTTRRDAFRTIGSEPLGYYFQKKAQLKGDYRGRAKETVLMDRLDSRVSIVFFHPALVASDFEAMVQGKKAVVIMGTGMGHTASRLYESIKDTISSGTKVMMTSQCISGSVNLKVYSTGRELLSLGVIPLGNMLPEVAMVKSMFVLANYPHEDFEKYITENMRGEIVKNEPVFQEVS
ncbi:MAG: Glu-tRNA(Gln) amidotransferase subunit GatD [Candidatus Thermoplasmatota archaeon]|nr:Glu-tRNA(Gln) amidotransferase subunit GatD [Candidatus Thermoplasmatota archaeon]MCL6089794.1 Glu-tRNA(Gln) amidotransferase subunit GatD [Candidatus Thermoplasmatota archaeon]MDA8143355.1 Glu-tRNA(Gln) amidotransferase subunit GatD [Thermoplasmatales archaeon]